MITLGLDTETTGLLTPDHRIVEIYMSLYKGRHKVWTYEQRIDPKRSISAEAQKVHGISSGDLIGKPTWEDVAPTIAGVLARADVIVAHNGAEFDGPFIDMELKRVGLVMPQKPIFDTMLEGIWACPDGKKPRLGELAFACGVDYDPAKAHAAAYDVDVMMDCYFRGIDFGFFGYTQEEGALLAA